MKTYYFYTYKLVQGGKGFIGFGITENNHNRHKVHMKSFTRNNIVCEAYAYQACKSKALAVDLEAKIKRKFCKELGLDLDSFRTESLPIEKFEEFRTFISGFDYFVANPEHREDHTFDPAYNFIKGSKPDKQHMFYVYEIEHKGVKYLGYGITKDIIERDYSHGASFASAGAYGKLLHVKAFQNKAYAELLERKMRNRFSRKSGLKINGFILESVLHTAKDEFFKILGTFNDDLANLIS